MGPSQHMLPCDIETLISQTISKTLVASAHQLVQYMVIPSATHHPIPLSPPPPPSQLQVYHYNGPADHASSQQEYVHTDDSSLEDEEVHRHMEFSDDEDLLPDRPAFTGLFRPSLFKSLLHKVKMTTHLAASEGLSDPQTHPNHRMLCLLFPSLNKATFRAHNFLPK